MIVLHSPTEKPQGNDICLLAYDTLKGYVGVVKWMNEKWYTLTSDKAIENPHFLWISIKIGADNPNEIMDKFLEAFPGMKLETFEVKPETKIFNNESGFE